MSIFKLSTGSHVSILLTLWPFLKLHQETKTLNSHMSIHCRPFFSHWLMNSQKGKKTYWSLRPCDLSFSNTIRPTIQISNDLISIALQSITHNICRAPPQGNLLMLVTLWPFLFWEMLATIIYLFYHPSTTES